MSAGLRAEGFLTGAPGMGTRSLCRICDGALELHVEGAGDEVGADELAPSVHEPGRHGGFLICRDCGCVQQPALAGGTRLLDLYRDARDAAYLDEEVGRRATARRLRDLIGARVPAGRLLDVGCGPGLLLDEARRCGYAPVGLEVSRAAARHATEVLGLDVRGFPFEACEPLERFDVVVLADVLEPLEDPRAGVE